MDIHKIDSVDIGRILSARAQCNPDEKIIVHQGMIVRVPKTSIDRLVDRLMGRDAA